jgi:transketolase C-terminal domain/subunit
MLYSSLAYAKGLALIGLLPLVLGIPMFAISRSMDRRRKRTTE